LRGGAHLSLYPVNPNDFADPLGLNKYGRSETTGHYQTKKSGPGQETIDRRTGKMGPKTPTSKETAEEGARILSSTNTLVKCSVIVLPKDTCSASDDTEHPGMKKLPESSIHSGSYESPTYDFFKVRAAKGKCLAFHEERPGKISESDARENLMKVYQMVTSTARR
jgi:hypothetical protein